MLGSDEVDRTALQSVTWVTTTGEGDQPEERCPDEKFTEGKTVVTVEVRVVALGEGAVKR